MTEPDFSNLSIEEIQNLVLKLKNEIIKCSQQNEEIDKDIMKFKNLQKDVIARIPEIQEIARLRNETLEKTRRYQRKLLSIYTRFPGILESDTKHVISSDILSLKRQLENAKKRKLELQKTIEQTKNELELMKEQKIEMVKEDNIQDEIMSQREQTKLDLAKVLRKELDSAKLMYTSENRFIEQRLAASKFIISEATNKYNLFSSQFNNNTKARNHFVTNLPPESQKKSLELQQFQQRVLVQTEKFLNWWTQRRFLSHLQDRNNFLKECKQSTQERVDDSFKSMVNLLSSNKSREEELAHLEIMNNDLLEKIKLSEEREKKLKNELEEVQKSFVPLPEEITTKLKRGREQHQHLLNAKKSMEIDFQILTDTSPEAQKALNRLDKVKKDHWNATLKMVELRESIQKCKETLQTHQTQAPNRNISYGAMEESRILLSEDANNKKKHVVAGPIEILSKILFEPMNDDELYPYAFLVMVHTIKSDLPTVIKQIISAYDSGEYTETRNQRLNQLLNVWNKWFRNDFQQAHQLVSLCGWTKPPDFDINDNFEFEDTLEIDLNNDIAFISSPLIIAQHFAYFQLQILYSIPASEFIGTGWSKPEKWVVAPNIMKMTEHFNTMTSYIINSILSKNTPEERSQYIERWIEILLEAIEIFDYQFVFIIFGALCNPAIARLTNTWQLVSKESKDAFDKIQTFTSPTRQFQNYKEALNTKPHSLIVPYIGPMLTNMVYTHDGNQTKRQLPGSGEEVINFNKFRIYSSIMLDVMQEWGKDIKFIINKRILLKIKQIPPPEMSDAEAYQLSTKIEP